MSKKKHRLFIEDNQIVFSGGRKPIYHFDEYKGYRIYITSDTVKNKEIFNSFYQVNEETIIRAGFLQPDLNAALEFCKKRIDKPLPKFKPIPKAIQKPKTLYERKSVHSIDEVLAKTIDNFDIDINKVPIKKYLKSRISCVFDGEPINMVSGRYQTFKHKGIKCVTCGIEGKFFAMEKQKGVKRYHFNLYAVKENGEEVLMTKDHIMPKSKGGKDHISNYQTMCIICNNRKQNKLC